MVLKGNYFFRETVVPGAPWAFIAVMGVTGVGKSSFIQLVTKNEDVEIGHDLESCKIAALKLRTTLIITRHF